ncbi:uncharacterized protein BDZ99DRAFT_513240 [Mytilinidion resinicola]|uniref:Rhodopsin domain-containing protein n=1 Tax=Mytilinidion resinicola TaxID=574789 RepID=A0A6A6Z9L8_9PEZI|nr:uncharacterized protein BDZ99DRAFT_513240 [Mytilinidion resinicola]KAF2816974.1 hypothetical protein BDZ99DRAFT_513240 [Mytilinidion resinicola]
MPGDEAPLHRLSAQDRGPIVIISAYSWAFVTLLISFIRFSFARAQRLPFKLDDWSFSFAAIFALANSVCFHIATNGGLGRHIADLSPGQLDEYYKAMYAAQLVGIASMAFAKTSFFLLADRVAPQFPRTFYSIIAMIAAWAVFSILSISFQCHLPRAWVYVPSDCPTHGYLQYPIIIGNALTDAFLALWFLPTIWRVLIDKNKRIAVIALFGTRILVSFTAIAQMVIVGINLHKKDQTRATWVPAMVMQAVVNLSVLSATIPRTNHFFASLHAGLVTMRLTDFELDASLGLSRPQHPRRREEPPLKLVPSGTEGHLQTNVSGRSKRSEKRWNKFKGKKRAVDWQNTMSMGSTRDDENSTSSLYNSQGGIAMRQTQETKIEYVKRQPILVRRP